MLEERRSEGGTNEIATIPRPFEVLRLEGCIVNVDAMGCQTDVAEAMTEAGGRLRASAQRQSGEPAG